MRELKKIAPFILLIFFCGATSQAGSASHLISKITLTGQTQFEAEFLLKTAGWHSHPAFSDVLVESGIDKILRLYENSGYPYCQVTVEGLSFENENPQALPGYKEIKPFVFVSIFLLVPLFNHAS